jgi:hypothetical protein
MSLDPRYCYAECCHAECYYDECRGTLSLTPSVRLPCYYIYLIWIAEETERLSFIWVFFRYSIQRRHLTQFRKAKMEMLILVLKFILQGQML